MASPARRDRSIPAKRLRRPDKTGPNPAAEADAQSPASSAARRLQAALESRYRIPEAPPPWSRRRTLAFVVVTSAVLWGFLIAATLWGIRLISG